MRLLRYWSFEISLLDRACVSLENSTTIVEDEREKKQLPRGHLIFVVKGAGSGARVIVTM